MVFRSMIASATTGGVLILAKGGRALNSGLRRRCGMWSLAHEILYIVRDRFEERWCLNALWDEGRKVFYRAMSEN